MAVEPAGRMQIPGGLAGRRGPSGQIGPAARASNEHPHPRVRRAVGSTASSAANASPIPTRV
jgi:hypothetical protein